MTRKEFDERLQQTIGFVPRSVRVAYTAKVRAEAQSLTANNTEYRAHHAFMEICADAGIDPLRLLDFMGYHDEEDR